MAAAAQPVEQATESLKKLTLDPQAKPVKASETKKQAVSAQGDAESSEQSPGTTTDPGPPVEASGTPGTQDVVMESNVFYAPNNYAPQAYYCGSYDSPISEWEEYPRYVNVEDMEIPSGVYMRMDLSCIILHMDMLLICLMALIHQHQPRFQLLEQMVNCMAPSNFNIQAPFTSILFLQASSISLRQLPSLKGSYLPLLVWIKVLFLLTVLMATLLVETS